jgi:hypothetical protein
MIPKRCTANLSLSGSPANTFSRKIGAAQVMTWKALPEAPIVLRTMTGVAPLLTEKASRPISAIVHPVTYGAEKSEIENP